MHSSSVNCPFLSFVFVLFVPSVSFAGNYSNAVLALHPDHYYRLNEAEFGTVFDNVTNAIEGKHEGMIGSDSILGDDTGQVGVSGPIFAADGSPLLGFDADNRALFSNNGLAVNLGHGQEFAHTTMTVAMWFRAPCDENNPGTRFCADGLFGGVGDRIWTNNLERKNTGGGSDIDDLGYLRIGLNFGTDGFGLGTNLVVSIDERFSGSLKSNFATSDLLVRDHLWHHLVVSRNGDNLGNVILVFDGENITKDRWVETNSWEVAPPFETYIGAGNTAPHFSTFNGWIDETAIWLGRQLTIAESQALYQAALGERACDLDGSGACDVADVDLLTAAILANSDGTRFDLDGNGTVDLNDREFWVENLENTYFGDSNLDGEFNTSDLVTVFAIGEYEDGIALNSGWGDGDWNGDRDFDSSDFVTAFHKSGYEVGPRSGVHAVPEPSTLSACFVGLLIYIFIRMNNSRAVF